MRPQFVLPVIAMVSPIAFAQPVWFDQAAASARIHDIQVASGAPAMSAAIVRLDGQGVGTAVSGVRRFGDPAPVTAADRFHVGSNSKAFTAQIAARAVDAGQISWDTTVDEIFGGQTAIDPGYAGVTLRQLLTHQGGTPQYGSFEDWFPLGSLPGTPAQQREKMARNILAAPRAIAPGTSPFERYSNSGFGIAAAMVEQATGQAWESMITHTFNTGMGLGVHVGAPGEDGTAQPFGHVVLDGQLVTIGPGDVLRLPSAIAPAGDLNMSMTDLAEFGRQHLLGMSGLPNTLDISTSSISVLHDTTFGEGFFGMGWFDIIEPSLGLDGFGHTGSTEAFDSILYVDRVQGFAIAVASNGTTTGDSEAIGGALVDAMLAMRASVIPAPGAAMIFAAGLLAAAPRRRR
ncbi:MAG: serine hydrolase [Planctomycetota bacterium]|nr:serine hydrolase [Planctomycetota bacterium]